MTKSFNPKLDAYAVSNCRVVEHVELTSDELLREDVWRVRVSYELCEMSDGTLHAQEHEVLVEFYDFDADDDEEWTKVSPSEYRLPRMVRTVYNRAVKEF